MRRSNEDFVKHHRNKLKMEWPPAWVLVEVASFGAVSNLLTQLRQSTIRQAVADTWDMDEQTFCSLFHHLSVVRNVAAHHSRLWNRRFIVTPKIPKTRPAYLLPNLNRVKSSERNVYNTLVLLTHLVTTINPTSKWPARLSAHIKKLDPTLISQMGFPPNWRTLPLWRSV